MTKHDDTIQGLRQHNARGGQSRGRRFAHVVDNQLTTTRQIAQRLGVSESTALERVKRAQHPLTWEALQRKPREKAA